MRIDRQLFLFLLEYRFRYCQAFVNILVVWGANLEMRERVDWKKNHQTKYLISNTTKIFPKFYDKGVSIRS